MESKAFIFDNTVFIRHISWWFCKKSMCNLMYWLLFLKNHVVYLVILGVTGPPWTVLVKDTNQPVCTCRRFPEFYLETPRSRESFMEKDVTVATALIWESGDRIQNLSPFTYKYVALGKIVSFRGSWPQLYNETTCRALYTHLYTWATLPRFWFSGSQLGPCIVQKQLGSVTTGTVSSFVN